MKVDRVIQWKPYWKLLESYPDSTISKVAHQQLMGPQLHLKKLILQLLKMQRTVEAKKKEDAISYKAISEMKGITNQSEKLERSDIALKYNMEQMEE